MKEDEVAILDSMFLLRMLRSGCLSGNKLELPVSNYNIGKLLLKKIIFILELENVSLIEALVLSVPHNQQ